jgi:ParB-like chromosome segregation protein Spo0J
MELRIHPVVNIFPPMAPAEFAELKKDIQAHGQQHPIVVWRNQLIDGRHRLQACNELEVDPDIIELDDDADPVQFAISQNLHRRHLNESQRAMIAAKLATMRLGDNQHTKEGGPIGLPSSKAADMLKVGERTVKRAKQVLDHGSEELQELVESGEVSVSKAAKIAKTTPKDEQAARATAKQQARDAIQAEREAVAAWVNRFDKFENRTFALKELVVSLEPAEFAILGEIMEGME